MKTEKQYRKGIDRGTILYVMGLPDRLKQRFKAACAERRLSMTKAFTDHMTQVAEIGKIPEEEAEDRIDGSDFIFVRNLDPEIKKAYVLRIELADRSIKSVVRNFMRKFVTQVYEPPIPKDTCALKSQKRRERRKR